MDICKHTRGYEPAACSLWVLSAPITGCLLTTAWIFLTSLVGRLSSSVAALKDSPLFVYTASLSTHAPPTASCIYLCVARGLLTEFPAALRLATVKILPTSTPHRRMSGRSCSYECQVVVTSVTDAIVAGGGFPDVSPFPATTHAAWHGVLFH